MHRTSNRWTFDNQNGSLGKVKRRHRSREETGRFAEVAWNRLAAEIRVFKVEEKPLSCMDDDDDDDDDDGGGGGGKLL